MIKLLAAIIILLCLSGCVTTSAREAYLNSVPNRPQEIKNAIRDGHKLAIGMTKQEVEDFYYLGGVFDKQHTVTEYGAFDTWYCRGECQVILSFENGILKSWTE